MNRFLVLLLFACGCQGERERSPSPSAAVEATIPDLVNAPDETLTGRPAHALADDLAGALPDDPASPAGGHLTAHAHGDAVPQLQRPGADALERKLPGLEEFGEFSDADHWFAKCKLKDERSKNPVQLSEALLQRAARSYRRGRYAQALACASIAADSTPRSVDAQRMRATAAAAAGRFDLAQTAFALALALDPDQPATLATAADFYINAMPRTGREPILVGLEYARRGSASAAASREKDATLRARLMLLEAQALNDLGLAEEALVRAEETLRIAPHWVEAQHERGIALFNLCRFAHAQDAFSRVVSKMPDDAYAHYHLGLIDERFGRTARSEDHFRKAIRLAPDEFWEPVHITEAEFRREVDAAVTELPIELQVMLENVAIELVDLPSLDDLMAVDPPFSPTILGLFRGLPIDVDGSAYRASLPSRAIVLYRLNLARAVKSRAELDAQIRRTLLHEIGHLSGLDEDALRRRGLE